jgi:hypothetical protein
VEEALPPEAPPAAEAETEALLGEVPVAPPVDEATDAEDAPGKGAEDASGETMDADDDSVGTPPDDVSPVHASDEESPTQESDEAPPVHDSDDASPVQYSEDDSSTPYSEEDSSIHVSSEEVDQPSEAVVADDPPYGLV